MEPNKYKSQTELNTNNHYVNDPTDMLIIAEEQKPFISNQLPSSNQPDKETERQLKFAEFLRTEKLKKYKRAPRVFG